MKDWKIVLLHNEKTIELTLSAASYSDAYIKAELLYPDSLIKSIKQVDEK
ncbi:MAG: hypothetical protein K0S12_1451 [Bacteroidetes bacterium]|nr:hypothetical protein [Bacteroidota bacterium]